MYTPKEAKDALSVTSVGRRSKRHDWPMKETTDVVLEDLVKDSPFFQNNPSRYLPSFSAADVRFDEELGRGEFGIVYAITQINDSESSNVNNSSNDEPENSSSKPLTVATQDSPVRPPSSISLVENELLSPMYATPKAADVCKCVQDDFSSDDDEEDTADGQDTKENKVSDEGTGENLVDKSPAVIRSQLVQRVWRDGQPRYALKRMRLSDKLDHALDLACEALFLQSIQHTNIIRLRATVDQPGTPTFGMILDRLVETLYERWWKWYTRREQKRRLESQKTLKLLKQMLLRGGSRKRPTEEKEFFLLERLIVALDIARALAHLHRHSILFRDLKPDNIGYNVRDDVQIFDFGLAKELRAKDRVDGSSDLYDSTGLTGSRRYMAPEVVKCEPYGFAADVYSYAILFWQLFALEVPYAQWDAARHTVNVVQRKRRPPPSKCTSLLPTSLVKLMEMSWSDQYFDRPSMETWCVQLQIEHNLLLGDEIDTEDDRTVFLSMRSLQSRTGAS